MEEPAGAVGAGVVVAPDPGARFLDYIRAQRHLAPSPTNRASSLGFPCDRALWYERLHHQEAALPSEYLQGVFLFGQDYEEMLQRRLAQAGYRFRAQQVTQHWRHYNISGRPEGSISWDEGQTWHTYEIKGLHPNYFDRVNSWRDFLTLGPIYNRYPAQGQIYCLLENVPGLWWVIGKKGTYDVKWLWMDLDYELAETYLKKAERINRMVENGPEPARAPDDPNACEVCSFRLACLPDQDAGAGAELLDDPDFVEELRTWERLRAAQREYEAADRSLKAKLRHRPLILVGEYRIEGKAIEKRAFTVPARTEWRTTIVNTTAAPATT